MAKYEKGQSGNPNGRPCANKALAIYINGNTNDLYDVADRVIKLLGSKKEATAMWAAEWLRDTTIGKPKQAVEHTGEDGGPVEISIINYAQNNPPV